MRPGEVSRFGRGLWHAVLENGLTVLAQEVHSVPLVSVWSWYRVGSKDEGPGRTGVSHWVEHMNFKGTRHISREDMTGIVERHGGSWNGYTWIDQTAYLETAAREALDELLFLEAERMTGGLYEPEACEAERTVIISELQGGLNDPEQVLDIEVTATAFSAHPYRHPTIGWPGDLRSMTREDLYEHYRSYYLPNNATVVVVGDMSADDVIQRVERRFGDIPPGSLPRRLRTVEPPQAGERRVRINREASTPYLKVVFHAPAVGDPDFLPMVVLDAILTGAKGVNLWSSYRTQASQRRSRLYRALVDGRLASGVTGALLPTQEPFLYTISVTGLSGAGGETLEERLLEELGRVARDGVTRVEIDRALRQLKARLILEDDSVGAIAHQLGFFATVSSVETYLALADRISRVDRDDVARVAGRYLVESNRTVGWYGSASDGAPGALVPERSSGLAAASPTL
jgi:zinc protease